MKEANVRNHEAALLGKKSTSKKIPDVVVIRWWVASVVKATL